ncbi:MAG TPA: DNA polymerase Y family protein, partial [Terriglobales bacterium]|nr:DNA polymerase Y family protein [Terriglobales bacterium]
MSFAAIHVPDFLVAAVVRMEPALREKAVVVLEGKPPTVTVAAMNETAAEIGIELGMTKLQAAAYPVELRPRSAAQEAAAHAALLDCAQAFSPRVEDTAPDTVVLDAAGLDRLFGPPNKLAQDLAQRARELGLEVNVAVAANPDAAILAARGFAGITVIPPGKQAERLGPLAVDVLQVTPEILETLDRWGVRNLRALAALPDVAMVERLGQEGLRLRKLARGAVERPLVPADPPLEFEETMELEYPLALLEPLAFILERLLEQLCARLEARALATNELRLIVGLDLADAGEDVSRSSFLVSRENQVSVEKRETRD